MRGRLVARIPQDLGLTERNMQDDAVSTHYAYFFMYMYVNVHKYMCIYIYICIYTSTYVYRHTSIDIHIYI